MRLRFFSHLLLKANLLFATIAGFFVKFAGHASYIECIVSICLTKENSKK